MLKYALLAGAMTIAAPALAQTAANPTPGAQAATPTAPVQAATPDQAMTTAPKDAAMPQTSAPTSTAQAQPQSTAPQPTTPQPTTAPTEQAATQPAPSGDQVAQVVDTEFPTYDANKDGKLSASEFSTWMVALKTKTDPTTKATSPDTKKWVSAAFIQADTDKNKSLSKTELTGFLSQGQS